MLVLAKAPVPGQAKTRLGARVGDAAAAGLAAAAILDTLDACEEVWTSREDRHLALAGELAQATDGDALRERLAAWTVHPQVGDGFAERLARAHSHASRVAGVPVVQIGMDTPHVTAAALRDVVDRLAAGAGAVVGPAEDGGWWVLGVRDPAYAGIRLRRGWPHPAGAGRAGRGGAAYGSGLRSGGLRDPSSQERAKLRAFPPVSLVNQ